MRLAMPRWETAYWIGFQQYNKTKDWVDNASRNCQKSLSLNPELVEGHVCLGMTPDSVRGSTIRRYEQFQRAMQLPIPAAKMRSVVWLTRTPTWETSLPPKPTYKKAIALAARITGQCIQLAGCVLLRAEPLCGRR